MGIKFAVFDYTIENLITIFSNKGKTDSCFIKEKIHTYFFQNYFNSLEAKTILVEDDYIDRDYLEDYASYYVRSFADYPRKCSRLHFFQDSFSEEDFNRLLQKEGEGRISHDSLQDSYLGFIVIKPIPLTFIGRTCLKTYPAEDRRNFPNIRQYKANLYGLELEVQSLAYQEQDCIVAACATSALWSVFQGTGLLFQHAIPTPVEITKAATKHLPFETRYFPNKGLSPEQMAHAIRSVGLEPYLIRISHENFFYLASTIYAYLHCGIPLIMGMKLFDISMKEPKFIGKHAVAVTGFNLGDLNPFKYDDASFSLTASRINKIYVHDDQVGPFARMEIDGFIPIKDPRNPAQTIKFPSLTTSWRHGQGNIGDVKAVPDILLIPLYHKIRIPFHYIHDTILHLDSFFQSLNKFMKIPSISELEWDIFLTTISELKSDIFMNKNYNGSYYRDLLVQPMPRFLWRAIAYVKQNPVIELLFDATDIEQGNYFLRPIEINHDISRLIREAANALDLSATIEHSQMRNVLQWFKTNS